MPRSRYSARQIALSGIIAALYAVLSYLAAVFSVAFGPVQFRFSEALCLLPCLIPEAVPGLVVGCLAANLLSPYGALDILFGTLATLLGAVWTRRIRRRALAPLPTVLCNALIVGTVLAFQQSFGAGDGTALFLRFLGWNALTVGAGEAAVCYLLGLPLLRWAERTPALRRYLSEKG